MRISVLIPGSPLGVLAHAMQGLEPAVKREIGARTKGPAADMWRDELGQHVETRLQGAVARSGAVGVTQQNVTLRAGGAGALSSGTPVSVITKATEFGMRSTRLVDTTSRKGKAYKRRGGTAFGPPRRKGNTVYPAAREVIARIASFWVQTAHRTIREFVERL